MLSVKSNNLFLPDVGPYALGPDEKSAFLSERLGELLAHHRAGCAEYAVLARDWERHADDGPLSAENYPVIPVTAFKEYSLRSVTTDVMTLESSATTSANASKIHVDRATKKRQTASANRVMSDFIGEERRPYLVFDMEQTVRGTASLSARGAAILSLAHHASEFHFVVREEEGRLQVDDEALLAAIDAIDGRPFVAYGFTYILYQAHEDLAARGVKIPAAHPESVMMHSGGWKRLADIAVDKAQFNKTVAGVWGLDPARVIDFYGTIEQVGVPYPDCSAGRKHVPYWADVVIRRPDTFAPAEIGETGLIQLVNCLPLSAPNHSVLTEDLGRLELVDGCPCGRRGKAFVFQGRAPKAEFRGCSDVTRT